MGGCPAPRLVGNPGPAVGRPAPMAVRVGAPAGRHARRPDVADLGLVAPVAVALELARVRVELARQVLGRARGPAVLRLPLQVPAREVVLLVDVEGGGLLGLAAPARVGALAFAEPNAAVAVVEHGLAAVDAHARLAAGGVEPDHRLLQRLHGAGRRLDLEARRIAGAQAHHQAAGPEPEHDPLRAVLLVAGVVHLAARVEPHDRSVRELELGPAVGVGPDPVPGQERLVDQRLLGAHLGRALDADPGLHVAQAPVAISLLRPRRRGGENQRGDEAGGSGEGKPHARSPVSGRAPKRTGANGVPSRASAKSFM